jgi:hypothetical protein
MADNPRDIIKRFTNDLKEKTLKQAAARALNKTATSVRAEAAKQIKQQLPGLKSSDIKADAFEIVKANSKDDLRTMRSILVVKGKPIPLVKFAARTRGVRTDRGKRVGVTVNVKGTRKMVQHAFLATINGYTGIFQRKGKDRGPAKQLFSTSVTDIFKSREFLRGLKAFALERLRTVLQQELNFELTKQQGKASGGGS